MSENKKMKIAQLNCWNNQRQASNHTKRKEKNMKKSHAKIYGSDYNHNMQNMTKQPEKLCFD